MDFSNKTQEEVYGRVKGWMKDVFGDFAQAREDAPAFGVFVGSALAEVWVAPWRTDDAVVVARSFVVTGVEMRQDLLEWLLKENGKLMFGGFALDDANNVVFSHSMPGAGVDRAELKASVMAVLTSADRYDDEIRARWGGQRAVDR
jgi:hypothetical protein